MACSELVRLAKVRPEGAGVWIVEVVVVVAVRLGGWCIGDVDATPAAAMGAGCVWVHAAIATMCDGCGVGW